MLIDLIGGKEMKQRLIMLFFTLISINSIFPIDWKTELKKQFITDSSIQLGSYEYSNLYTRENNFLSIQYNLEMPIDKLECKELESAEKIHAMCYRSKMNIFSDFQLKDDGYLYGKIANESSSFNPVIDVPMIFGDMFSFAIPGATFFFKIGSEGYSKWLYFDGNYKQGLKAKEPFTKVYNDIIKKVNSSSHLVETNNKIEFNYSGISLDWFIIHSGGEMARDEINPYCFPWVEDIEGPGIGEWVEFELNTPQTITYILNGFVDGNRMHLYKANSRMKEAEITGCSENGKEIKQNVHFEDFVYFKTVQFSEPVIKFRITIKEAYSGDKWQDTCISAVMFPVERK